MTQELSPDVKKYLLSYTSIYQLDRLARDEMIRIYGRLESDIACQNWFLATDFETKKSWKWFQVWKKDWHPIHDKRIPFIHLEYAFPWSEKVVQASLDIEAINLPAIESTPLLVEKLYETLAKAKLSIFDSKGWMLKSQLEANRMLIVKRQNIDADNFSAEWIFKNGSELINQLSEIIPHVDEVVQTLFS